VEPNRDAAAKVLAAGGSQAAAAKAASVNRSTVLRWLEDADFADAAKPDLGDSATQGLADLVPKALELLERAMNKGDVPATKARVALDIVKAAANLKQAETGGGTLVERLREIEARDVQGD